MKGSCNPINPRPNVKLSLGREPVFLMNFQFFFPDMPGRGSIAGSEVACFFSKWFWLALPRA